MEKVYKITDDKFLEAKQLITANGGIIYADNNFEISGVKGKFARSEDLIKIKITDKPWLAGWGMIENKLDEFFG